MSQTNQRDGNMLKLKIVLSFVFCTLLTVLPLSAHEITVPEGFTYEKVTDTSLTKYPMMAGFDDRGRLFIAENAGVNIKAEDLVKDPPSLIRMLEDTDNDGVFDKSTVFADKMTFPMGALWYRNALYVASPPYIWRLEDTDDDGVADKREILVDQFGFSGNAASIHGCFLSPTGRIFWCDGRHGHEFKDVSGKTTSKGLAARIFSSRPDGSDVQTFAGGGMDNPVEVDFMPGGDMLGTVNLMEGKPRVDTLIHWVKGGVYPKYSMTNCLEEFQRTGELLTASYRFGHVAVSGMIRYRGVQFGEEYRDSIFVSIFNTHRVVRVKLEKTGATYQGKEDDFFVSDDPDFHVTDVLEDADGSLLVINTGGWFRIGCPTSQVAKPNILGAIYRVRKKDSHKVNDPRGIKLNLEKQPEEKLAKLLDDSRFVVREKTTDLLALQEDKAIPVLESTLKSGSETARLNSVWSLSRMKSEKAIPVIQSALTSEYEDVRQAAAQSLGLLKDSSSINLLLGLLNDSSPSVQREAATSIGQIVLSGNVSESEYAKIIHELLVPLQTGKVDRFGEHARIFSVINLADREGTLSFLEHTNPQVRRAALIALDQMENGNLTRELVTPLLDTDDQKLQQTVLEIMNDHEGWTSEILALLNDWIKKPELSETEKIILRGTLLAHAQDGDLQKLIAGSLNDASVSPSTKGVLLEVIYRSSLPKLPDHWINSLTGVLKGSDEELKIAAIRTLHSRKVDSMNPLLLKILNQADNSPALRIQAILASASTMKKVNQDLFEFLSGQLDEDQEPLHRLEAAKAMASLPLNDQQLNVLVEQVRTADLLTLPLLLRAYEKSESETVGQNLLKGLSGSDAFDSLPHQQLYKLLEKYPPSVQAEGRKLLVRLGVNPELQKKKLDEFASLQAGGDIEKGKEIFTGKKTACAGCHTIGGQGGKVGPDLSRIGRIRTGRDLTEAIIFPSASFAREYQSYQVLTGEGYSHTGVISRQTGSEIFLRTADLSEIRIPRTDIEEMKESQTSVMPQGFDKLLTKEEIRDLLAYLQSLK